MKSGMLAAEAAFNAMTSQPAGQPLDLSGYEKSFRSSWVSCAGEAVGARAWVGESAGLLASQCWSLDKGAAAQCRAPNHLTASSSRQATLPTVHPTPPLNAANHTGGPGAVP